jgi:hypothetical protein
MCEDKQKFNKAVDKVIDKMMSPEYDAFFQELKADIEKREALEIDYGVITMSEFIEKQGYVRVGSVEEIEDLADFDLADCVVISVDDGFYSYVVWRKIN